MIPSALHCSRCFFLVVFFKGIYAVSRGGWSGGNGSAKKSHSFHTERPTTLSCHSVFLPSCVFYFTRVLVSLKFFLTQHFGGEISYRACLQNMFVPCSVLLFFKLWYSVLFFFCRCLIWKYFGFHSLCCVFLQQ